MPRRKCRHSLDTNNIEAEQEESAEEVHGRSELEPLEAGRLPQPSDFALHVELWRADGAHPYSLHAPFTPNESRWHMALLEVDLVRVT